MEKSLLLVYGLFKNLKNLMFVMVRCHKTINGAICIRCCLSFQVYFLPFLFQSENRFTGSNIALAGQPVSQTPSYVWAQNLLAGLISEDLLVHLQQSKRA